MNTTIRPLGAIKRLIPGKPNSTIAIVDACLAFYPSFFRECPALREVEGQLGNIELLDFDKGMHAIPAAWQSLRAQSAHLFAQLHVFKADLLLMDLSGTLG